MIKKRALIVLTGIDSVRIKHALQEIKPHNVYVIKNSKPWNEDIKTHIKHVHEQILQIIESFKSPNNPIVTTWIGTDFLDYPNSRIRIFELLCELKVEKYDLYVEASGGITPMTFALKEAAELAGIPIVYHVAEGYTEDGKPTKIREDPIPLVAPIALDIVKPDDDTQTQILLTILELEAAASVKIAKSMFGPGKGTRITRKIDVLEAKKLIERSPVDSKKWRLTEAGKYIAVLLQTKDKIVKEKSHPK